MTLFRTEKINLNISEACSISEDALSICNKNLLCIFYRNHGNEKFYTRLLYDVVLFLIVLEQLSSVLVWL